MLAPMAPPPAVLEFAATQQVESVGTATMSDDGTIVLQLRTSGPAIGEARLVYRRGDPQYQEVLRHLGAILPGETKPVAPFPDEPSRGR